MTQNTILDLNQFCYFELFRQIKRNCEQANGNPEVLDDFKYVDLRNFLSTYRLFRVLFYEWDRELSERLFLLDVRSSGTICIDFAELYSRLKKFPEKVRQSYWKSLTLAIEENENLSSVELRYSPESHHSEHLDIFESVMSKLRAKKSLKRLTVHIAGYTLEDLNGFANLEELLLDVNVDTEELTECCRRNERISFLTVYDLHSGGRRLADIVPFCSQVRKFAFKMKYDCDATEYAPLAKMPKLEKLQIWGEHEPGTLQALLGGLARREPKPQLSTLFVDDAILELPETTELSRIESLTKLRYRFAGPQDIGPLTQLTNLKNVDIISQHDFQSIADPICSVLKQSQRPRKVFLPGCLIRYNPKEDALLLVMMENHNAGNYSPLMRLPGLKSVEINGHHRPGTLVKLFEELARVGVSTLTIDAMNAFALIDFTSRGWKLSYPDYPVINAQEIVALSKCKSLRKLICGISDTRNIELLAKLSELRALTITSKPDNGSLLSLFADLAASKSPNLRDFELLNGRINCQEATALSQIGSLKSLDCNFYEAEDIELFSSLGWANLETLRIRSEIKFQEISHVIIKVSQFCGNKFVIDTQDVTLEIDRQQKHLFLGLDIDNQTIYSPKTLLLPLAKLEWLESLVLNLKPFNLSMYFNAIARSGHCHLKKIRILDGFLDPNETEELGKMKSLKEFHGRLTDTRSLEHLRHLSYLKIGDSFENLLPKSIVTILDSIEEALTIRLRGKEVSYNVKTGHLILSNTGWNGIFISSNNLTDFAPLASLKSLKSVRIFGNHMGSSLQLFFAQLASRQSQTLRELEVESKQEDPDLEDLTISPSELEEITSIKSLQKLKCGFSDAQNLELIAGLPQLTELVISTHRVGSLKDLLGKMNSMDSPRLEYLAIEGGQLTAEEEVQVTAMRSLKRLECGYSSTVVVDYRGQPTGIGEMSIKKDRKDISLVELFRSRPLLKSLIVKGAPLNRDEADEIRKIKTLQRLIYRFDEDHPSIISDLFRLSSELNTLVITSREHSLAQFEDAALGDTIARLPQDISRDLQSFDGFEGVVQFLDPQRLVIELPPEMHCLKFLFEALAQNKSQSLQQLVIRHRYIGLEEAACIAQISSLKRLMCGLEDSSSLSVLCNLKRLEGLEIRSLDNFDQLSDHLLNLLELCKDLESIDLDFSFPMQYIKSDFLLRAASTLKSVRNPRVQPPLKLIFSPKKRIFKDPVPAIKDYLSLEGARELLT